jgi:hypothetical protein
MKYIVKLKDGRKFEAIRTIAEDICPLGLSLLKRDNPEAILNIPNMEGEEVKTTFGNIHAIEVIF